MYALLLFAHSYLRWPLLALLLLLLARGAAGWITRAAWRPADGGLLRSAAHLAAAQFVVGLVLYVAFSPSIRAAWEDPGAAMRDPQLRYFFVEHALIMAAAVTFLSIAAGRIRRAAAARRFRGLTIAALITLLLMAASIPWPGMSAGRPLLRAQAPAASAFY